MPQCSQGSLVYENLFMHDISNSMFFAVKTITAWHNVRSFIYLYCAPKSFDVAKMRKTRKLASLSYVYEYCEAFHSPVAEYLIFQGHQFRCYSLYSPTWNNLTDTRSIK